MTPVLIVVHPGSACGSADFNLGRLDARAARESLVDELNGWSGPLVVIDGALSDELASYPALNSAIVGAYTRAQQGGYLSLRLQGDDPEQVDRTRDLLAVLPDGGKGHEFVVTGAWYHPSDGGGCVGSVVEVLHAAGCRVNVSDSALCLGDENEEEFEDQEKG